MRRSYIILILLAICIALAFASIKPILNYTNSWVVDDLKATYPDTLVEQRLAEQYWSMYPDVAASSKFGVSGALGVYGARRHFQVFGQHENRKWPQ
ncbi:hypothetical protein [Magnetovibrio sp.]|uniref:hypothetical protein n=1 Tax=Magnetovibrio sp. TaxID=2024836 RepID=UPI002F94BA0C